MIRPPWRSATPDPVTPAPVQPAGATAPNRHRITSMCMEIAGFDHDDCPGDWCRCDCHEVVTA